MTKKTINYKLQSSLALSTTCRLKFILQLLAVACLEDRH